MKLKQKPTKPKILLLDIETTPNKAWVWDVWKEGNVVEVLEEWYILAVTVKWLGKKKMWTMALPQFPEWKKDKRDDGGLLRALRPYLDAADWIVAHNGDDFDIKRINGRFIANHIPPPKPYRTIDTRKIARQKLFFNYNRLDYLAKFLGVGGKKDAGGWNTWKGCIKGDPKAWRRMIRYNRHDVLILEQVFLKLLPWVHARIGGGFSALVKVWDALPIH